MGGGLFFALFLLIPVIWMILASLMSTREVTSRPQVYLPTTPRFDNFPALFQTSRTTVGGPYVPHSDIGPGLANSLIISSVVTALNLAFGIPAAFSIAQASRRGGRRVLLFYLATRMLPTASLMIPLFILFRTLNLLDTRSGLVLAYVPYTLPFSVWMLTVYFKLIPPELGQAALVDGCNRLRAMWRVILPVSIPALVSVAIFAFVGAWSEFLLAVVLTSSDRARPVTVAVANFATDIYINYNLLAAGGIVALIPQLLLALFFQRYIVTGLLRGAIQ